MRGLEVFIRNHIHLSIFSIHKKKMKDKVIEELHRIREEFYEKTKGLSFEEKRESGAGVSQTMSKPHMLLEIQYNTPLIASNVASVVGSQSSPTP